MKSHPEPDERGDGDGEKNTVTYPCMEALRLKLIEMRDAPGSSVKSNAAIARKLGYTPAVISQYLSEKGNIYDGDITKLEARISDFIRNDARRRASGVETVDCEAARQMTAAFELIRRTNDVGVILAASGSGKTRGAELYLASNPTAVLFRVFSWSCDKASLEGALFEAVGTAGYDNRTKRSIFMARKLAGSDRLLIADDAHKLTRPALQWLFDFADETGIPLGLVGTFALLEKLEDDPQRFSRVGLQWEIVPKNPRDLIEHLVKTLAPNANGSFKTLCELCEQVVAEHGHYRSAHKQLKLAAEFMAEGNKTWAQAFRQAHTQLVRKYKLA